MGHIPYKEAKVADQTAGPLVNRPANYILISSQE